MIRTIEEQFFEDEEKNVLVPTYRYIISKKCKKILIYDTLKFQTLHTIFQKFNLSFLV